MTDSHKLLSWPLRLKYEYIKCKKDNFRNPFKNAPYVVQCSTKCAIPKHIVCLLSAVNNRKESSLGYFDNI